jgi:hypothetical protein
MPEVVEYAPYDQAEGHLSENEALKRYERVRSEHPEALIILKDLDCGHWKLIVKETEAEKSQYIGDYFSRVLKRFWDTALKPR